MGRLILGLVIIAVGVLLALLRTVGAFGDPYVVDGGLVFILLLVGAGILLVAAEVDDTARRRRREQDEHR